MSLAVLRTVPGRGILSDLTVHCPVEMSNEVSYFAIYSNSEPSRDTDTAGEIHRKHDYTM